MLPVLIRMSFETSFARGIAYLLGAGIVGFSVRSAFVAAPKEERVRQAVINGLIAAAAVLFALSLILPRTISLPFFGPGKGHAIPIYSYGLLIALGFMSAITVSSWLARREWAGALGERRRIEVLDVGFYIFVGGILGSRELFVLVNFKDYLADPARAPEAYAVVIDMLTLVGLMLAVAFRDRFFPKAETRTWVLQKAFRIFITVVLIARPLLFMLSSVGLSGLLSLTSGGFVFYGGLIGAGLATAWYCLAHDIVFLRLSDIALPTVSLGQAFGRLGCFSSGCCWGKVSTSALAVNFPGPTEVKTITGGSGPIGSIVYSSMQDHAHESRWVVEQTGQVLDHAAAGAVRVSDWVTQHGHTLPIHPTQLYESLGQLIIFVALISLRGHRRFTGEISWIWLIAYAVLRSVVELFRGDLERGTLHGLFSSIDWTGLARAFPVDAWYNFSTSQLISLAMAAIGVVMLVRGFRRMTPLPA